METQHSRMAPPTVLFCSICDKPFAREAQLKRHLSYCRKHPTRTRPRSCRACNTSKIKCDFRPRCNQCVRRGIGCVYDHRKATTSQEKKLNDSNNYDETTSRLAGENQTASIGDSSSDAFFSFLESGPLPGSTSDDFFTFDNNVDMLNSVNLLPDVTLHDDTWDVVPKKPQFYLFNEAYRNGESLGFNKPCTMDRSTLSQQIQDLIKDSNIPFDVSFSYDLSPFTPITEIAPSVFRLNRMSAASKAYATMITDIIRPFPQMMMRRETFPPFVHPHLKARSDDGLPFPLKNCMSIAHMFFARNADTRKFVWSTIRSEMNDLVSNLHSFTKEEALAALSASLMYLIMRATDNEPQDSINDVEMIFIHQVICKRTIELADGAFSTAEPVKSDTNWNDWIFRESCRRLLWMWFSISLVFCIQSNIPCLFAVELRDKPLPSGKTEWEAQSGSQWSTEYMLAEVRRSQLSRFVDLFDAHKTNDTLRLNIWNGGIDNLGMLLNLSVYILRDMQHKTYPTGI